jgi:PAS domain S-box-containing protein
MRRTKWIITAGVIAVIGAVTAWTAQRADTNLRAGHLLLARQAAQAISVDRIKSLSGSEADLNSPEYLHLKKQLARMRHADPRCRFLYLLGQRPDGTVFFYVDSEPIGSVDESPPGQTFEEASEELLKLFTNRQEFTEGPVTDQWGTWISSLVPITDPETDALVAVFGRDADAADWWQQVAADCTLPVVLAAALAIALVASIALRLRFRELEIVQESLHQSERQHRLLFENAVSGIAVHRILYDRQGKPTDYLFLDVNPAFERHTGLRPEDVIGRHITEVLPGIENSDFISIYGDVVATGRPVSVERYSEPLKRHYNINAYKIADDRFAAVFQDITDRKQTEAALTESEIQLNTVVSSAQDAIIMMDARGCIEMWNPSAERIFGYSSEEALGKTLYQLLSPKQFCEAQLKDVAEFFSSGTDNAVGKIVELAALRKNGDEFPVELSLSSVLLKDGWHAIGIMHDITARKQAAEKLQNALAEAEEINRILEEQTARANHMSAVAEMANAAKSSFLANMSHEIRTPMNGVIGMTGLLLDTELDDTQRQYAHIVQSCGEALLGLINDILDYSKIEAGKLELEQLDFDSRDLLEDFAAMMAVRAHEKGLEFLCAANPDVPSYLRGDPGRVRQILTNLTGNAVKFTERGEVAVRVEMVSKNEHDVVLRFSVRDTGIGIPANKINLLFEKFTQVDASTTRKYGGTGLGLAISKQIAEKMGGQIGVNSREGQGSEFWFTVRLDLQPNQTHARKIPDAIAGKRILIVDDNAANREILATRLTAWGAVIVQVPDGPSALDELRSAIDTKTPFDIVITDMQMPDMDGLMLGAAIRQDDRIKHTRLILMTSLGQQNNSPEMADVGFAACIQKPIRTSELYARLTAAIAGNAPSKEAKQGPNNASPGPKCRASARILLAEDNITNQKVALGVLKKLGFRADPVANGAEAVKALEDLPYDLVLMDIQMPEMDGIEAAKIIRDTRSAVRNHNIPIIAMTAHAMQGDREKCIQAGMNDYVSKPVSPKTLADKLDLWLPRDEAPRAEAAAERTDTAVAAIVGSTVIYDRDGFLERLMGDAEMAQTVIEVFLDDIPKQIESLKASLADDDAETIERIVHSIKGAAANVGGEALREIAAHIEKACKNGNVDVAHHRCAELEHQFHRLKDAIRNPDVP